MILVAGGSGFLGRAIVQALAARGEPVSVMSHRPERAERFFSGSAVGVRAGDVQQPQTLPAALADCDTVINAVQFEGFPVENPAKGYTFEEVDWHGTERLVAAAQAAGVRRFIYLSGAGAAPDAEMVWFRAKWGAETAVRESGLTYTVIRPSWVYGPGDQSLNRFVGFARRLPFVPVIGSGRQQVQPVFVDDVAACVAESLRRPEAENKIFEAGGPQILTMNEVVRTLLEVLGVRKPMLHSPVFLVRLAARLLVRLPGRPLSPAAIDFATGDAVVGLDAVQTLQAALGVTPRPLVDGLTGYLGRS